VGAVYAGFELDLAGAECNGPRISQTTKLLTGGCNLFFEKMWSGFTINIIAVQLQFGIEYSFSCNETNQFYSGLNLESSHHINHHKTLEPEEVEASFRR
jgi:hypothetical protein